MTPQFAARLSPMRQRMFALALFVIAITAVLVALIVPVLLLHRHYDIAIADTTDRLERYRRVAAQAPEYRRALATMQERDGRRFFLKNTAPNLAGAEMQEVVKGSIEGNGGRITTSQNTSPRDDGRFKQIGVNVNFFATTGALQKILAALETQQPYLVVDNLAVRPLNSFRGFKPAPGQEPELNVQLDVSGWSYPETPPPAAKAPAKSAAAASGGKQ